MSAPGWYPDPNAKGRLRYWDGSSWSPQQTAVGADRLPGQPSSREPTAAKIPRPLLVGAIGVLLVGLIALVWYAVSRSTQALELVDLPAGTAASEGCPVPGTPDPHASVPKPRLSYPLLPAPFSAPALNNSLSYFYSTSFQEAFVEQRKDGTLGWVAELWVGMVADGDGFPASRSGAERLAKCTIQTRYRDMALERADRLSQAIQVDGREGWVVEAQLKFDVPNIRTKGEVAIILVVETPDGTGGVFAALPDTSPQLNKLIRGAIADLRVT